MLPRERVSAGIALTYGSFQIAMLGGPALAGAVIATGGVAAGYGLGMLAFTLAFGGLSGLPRVGSRPSSVKGGETGTLAGLRAIRARPPLRGALLTDLAAMSLAMPIALFPALNEARFGGAPETLGLFLSALAAGGIAATLLSGAVTAHPRPGAVQLTAATVWGAALMGVGFASSGPATLALLVLAGAADTVAGVTRGTVVQLACPPEARGRVLAVDQIVGVGSPQLGNFRAGALGVAVPPGMAVACGGALCVAAVVAVAWSHPTLRRFRASDPA